MINYFRAISNNTITQVLLGVLMLSFSVWGVGDMLRTRAQDKAVATVGGVNITADEYAHALHRETENVQIVLGDRYSPELVKSLNLPQRVLRRLINEKLIALESQALGLIPGDAEVAKVIRSNPRFIGKNSAFDKGIFDDTLKNSNLSEANYVKQLRQDIAANLLLETIKSAAPISDMAVKTLYDAQEEQRAIALYTITASLVPAFPAPDETQVKAYYDAHKNDFTAPEYRTVGYVTVTPADVHPVISEDEIKAAYKERADDFKHPERRTVEQLLYSSEDEAKAAENLLKNGKSFADVAKTTKILNKNSLSLGKVTQNAILPAAADAVFSLPSGGHTAPISSPFGWHIFHVTAIEPPSVSPLDEVRPQLEKDLKQRDNAEAQSALTDKLQDALAGGSTLKEAAADLKLQLHSLGPIDRQGLAPDGSEVKNIPHLDKFLDTAFKTDDKSESPLMTAGGGAYYILSVDSVTPDHLRPLDDVRKAVVAAWEKEERQKRLAKMAKDIASGFSGSERNDIVATYNLNPVTGNVTRSSQSLGKVSLPPSLVTDVFRQKPQGSTGAYESGDGYLIAMVSRIIPAPPPDKDPKLTGAVASIRNNLRETVQNEILDEYTHYLAEKYNVSINEQALAGLEQ